MRLLLTVLLYLGGPNAALASQSSNGTGSETPAGITVAGPVGTVSLSAAQIAAMPTVTIAAAFGTAHGPFKASFSGPLLWTLLSGAGMIDPRKPRLALREYVLVSGADGYTALLAMGEIAPLFENKRIILATRMNGQTLNPQHFRIIVPGDVKGGRSVRDLARIQVATAGAAP